MWIEKKTQIHTKKSFRAPGTSQNINVESQKNANPHQKVVRRGEVAASAAAALRRTAQWSCAPADII